MPLPRRRCRRTDLVTNSDGQPVPLPSVAPRPYELPPLPPNQYYQDPIPPEAGRHAVQFLEKTDPFDTYTFALQKIVYSGKTAFQEC